MPHSTTNNALHLKRDDFTASAIISDLARVIVGPFFPFGRLNHPQSKSLDVAKWTHWGYIQ